MAYCLKGQKVRGAGGVILHGTIAIVLKGQRVFRCHITMTSLLVSYYNDVKGHACQRRGHARVSRPASTIYLDIMLDYRCQTERRKAEYYLFRRELLEE